MSADGAEVEGMTAGGNVIIANQADQSSALAGKAVYDRPRDLLTLTEEPVWWNDLMEVRGDTLSMSLSNKVYHAQGHARLKLRLSGAGGSPAPPINGCMYPPTTWFPNPSIPEPISSPFAGMSTPGCWRANNCKPP